MIQYATRYDVPQLRALWSVCFGEGTQFLDNFFQNQFRPDDTLVYREGNQLLGMTTIFEVWLDGSKGFYVYAVGTHPKAQGKGIMRKIDSFMQQEAINRGGCFTCLIPATPSLFQLYATLGYETAFYHKRTQVTGAAKIEFTSCSEDQFVALRAQYLQSIPHSILQQERDNRALYREWLHYGGQVFIFEEGSYVVWRKKDEKVFVRESSGNAVLLAQGLLQYTQTEMAEILSLPACGDQVAFGMGRMLNGESFIHSFHDVCYMPMMQE